MSWRWTGIPSTVQEEKLDVLLRMYCNVDNLFLATCHVQKRSLSHSYSLSSTSTWRVQFELRLWSRLFAAARLASHHLKAWLSVIGKVTERSQRDLWESTFSSSCQEASSFFDVTFLKFQDFFTEASVKAVHFLSHFLSYSCKMIVQSWIIWR